MNKQQTVIAFIVIFILWIFLILIGFLTDKKVGKVEVLKLKIEHPAPNFDKV